MRAELADRGIMNLQMIAHLSETDIMGFPWCMQTATRLMKERMTRLSVAYQEHYGLHLLSMAASSCRSRSLIQKEMNEKDL